MSDPAVFMAATGTSPDDRLPQLIFADWLDERGRVTDACRLRNQPPVLQLRDGNGGYGDGGGGDGGDGGYGGGYGDDGGDGGGDGGYGDDGGCGDGGGDGVAVLSRGLFMTDGLHIVHMPAGWSPYVVIAWCKISDGWVHFAPGYRVLRRFGGRAQVAMMAAKGPQADTQLLDPAPLAGGCSTACVSRFDVADPKAWAKEMPKPLTAGG